MVGPRPPRVRAVCGDYHGRHPTARSRTVTSRRPLLELAVAVLAALEEIAVAAYTSDDGFLLANCHGLTHTVGREYAVRAASRSRA